jgi:hypothetical protein
MKSVAAAQKENNEQYRDRHTQQPQDDVPDLTRGFSIVLEQPLHTLQPPGGLF